jgi:hypothetical protein
MSDIVEYAFVRQSSVSGELHTLRIAMTAEQYAELQRRDRRHLQELLPQCTDAQREFLMTGITLEEWTALTKGSKENGNDEHEPEPQAPRSHEEILEALRKLFDQVWYDRQQFLAQNIKDPETRAAALEAARSVKAKYPQGDLGPWDDFQWGMLNGNFPRCVGC